MEVSADDLAMLVRNAAAAVLRAVGEQPRRRASMTSSWATTHGASFVTLRQEAALRGCIGTLSAFRPLVEDVRENARAAALHDPRFAPLKADELPYTKVSVSVLGIAEALHFDTAADLLGQLRRDIDGVTVSYRDHRATYLPSVWQHFADGAAFIASLRDKAAIDPGVPLEALSFERYSASHSPSLPVLAD